jgi:transposase-like protein
MPTTDPESLATAPPDLDSLRRQLGDAMFDARLGGARRREEILKRLEAAMAGGITFEEAARGLGEASSQTLRSWRQQWRSFGLAGLVDRRVGPPPASARAVRTSSPKTAQLAFGMGEEPLERAVFRPPGGHRGPPPSPLLKWPGSKGPIVDRLASLAPRQFERYHEPFVGGGALFFALRPRRAVLGDDNAELVNLYRVVRDEPEALIAALTSHENTRAHYNRVRGVNPDALSPVERAARMFFLNRTCFNGLYRVNGYGLFNVPYGSQDHAAFFQPTVIREAHRALRGAEIMHEDFENCAGRAQPGDLVSTRRMPPP